MNKETLEEAAYQARRDYQDEVGKDGMNECIMFDAMKIQKGFELGGKWQAERMYSEADRIMKFLDTEKELKLSDAKTIERIKWYFETYFEQFKKK